VSSTSDGVVSLGMYSSSILTEYCGAYIFLAQVMPIPAHDVLVKSGGMSQILLWTSFLEIFGGIALFQTIQVPFACCDVEVAVM
jgi:hypothetical protein